MKMAIEKRNTLSNSLLAAGILYRQTGAKKWKDLEEKLTEILNAENNSSI